MAEQVRQMQAAVKQQADDLRDELKDLAQWEDSMKGKSGKKAATGAESMPPIRGTAPMVKPQVAPKEDPIVKMKEAGNEYFKKQMFEDAVRMYSKGIGMDPQATSTHILYANRALCHLKMQQWELAEKDSTTCIQMNRTYSKAFYRRALARKALKNLTGARSDLETVLVLSPGDSESQKELAAVTQAIKAEEAANQEVKTVKKKLVIEEVDDDEEDEDEVEVVKAAEAKEREVQRQAEAKKAAEEEEKRKQQFIKDQQAAQAKVKKSSKIEEIEDEEDSPPRAARTSGRKSQEAASKPRTISTAFNIEGTSAPKSFTEFERVYNEIKGDEIMLSKYLKKCDAAAMPAMFGSSITEEILVAILKAIVGLGVEGKPYLEAIVGFKRIEETIMFLDDEHKKVLNQAIEITGIDGAKRKQLEGMM